jgi:hypothetical protein
MGWRASPRSGDALEIAFNPNLGGGGPALFTQALEVFWLGLSVPYMGGVVVAFAPSGSVDSPQPDDATPQLEAMGLAQIIHTYTLASVKVLVGGFVVPLT